MASQVQRRALLLAGRDPFAVYAQALKPLVWLPMRAISGSREINRMYGAGRGPELISGHAGADHDGEVDAVTGFVEGSAASIISQDSDAQIGDYAIEIESTSSGQGQRYLSLTLERGATYRYRGRARSPSQNTDSGLYVWQGFHTSTISTATRSTNLWTNVNIELYCTVAAALLRYYTGFGGPGEILRLDDLSLYKIGFMDGRITGSTSLAQVGKRGLNDAFLFDGATSAITVYQGSAAEGMAEFSVWAQFKPASAGENDSGTLIYKQDEYELRFNSDSGDLYAIVHYDGSDAETTTSTTLSMNAWHEVAMRIDDTSKTIAIFVDGVEASYASQSAGSGSRVSNTNPTVIGNNSAVSATLDGLIDEVLIIDRALTDDELHTLEVLA